MLEGSAGGRYWVRTSGLCRVKAERVFPVTRPNSQNGRLTKPFAFSPSRTISHHLAPLAPPPRPDALASGHRNPVRVSRF